MASLDMPLRCFRLLTVVPLPLLLVVAIVKSNPDSAVPPPETVQSRSDEPVRRQVIDSRQVAAVLQRNNLTSRVVYVLPCHFL